MNSLYLADGSVWNIIACDKQANGFVSRFAEVMQLRSVREKAQQLFVQSDHTSRDGAARERDLSRPSEYLAQSNHYTVWIPEGFEENGNFLWSMLELSLRMCADIQQRGGILIHGALIEREGCGVVLAGPGEAGKTTACRRLNPPWKALSDDLTLVVRDTQGGYWAHPWPTWSQFMFGNGGGSWDVQHSTPLRGIYFLSKSEEDLMNPVGKGEALCLLLESAEQAWWEARWSRNEAKQRKLREQRFNNLCALVQAIPCYILQISLTGEFWREIETVHPAL